MMPLLSTSKLLLVAAFIVLRGILAFQPINPNHVYHLPASSKIATTQNRAYRYYGRQIRLPLSSGGGSINPNDFETPQEREERMKLVQQIQKSFYSQDDEDLVVAVSNDDDPTILENVPLWRVQWTELPGYQNILNCHVPHYTHMFHRILSNKSRPWLFGHVFLPGGSENLNNPIYRLPLKDGGGGGGDDDDNDLNKNDSPSQATLIGTLMQVSDYQQLPDGRLALIVQALERFQILHATQSVPYAIATIQLKPDLEAKTTTTTAASEASTLEQQAARENEEWRNWEFRRTSWEEVSSEAASGRRGVSPLVNYDGSYFPNELLLSLPYEGSTLDDRVIASLEHEVWVALDRMISLLARINPGLRIPVPSQLLGLLPVNESWPKGFQLEQHAAQLQKNNARIGTSTKSPFVRISENVSYPVRRRAARLSYVIWIILDSIALPGSPSRQELLEETSIAKRLKMAHTQLEAVTNSLDRLG